MTHEQFIIFWLILLIVLVSFSIWAAYTRKF